MRLPRPGFFASQPWAKRIDHLVQSLMGALAHHLFLEAVEGGHDGGLVGRHLGEQGYELLVFPQNVLTKERGIGAGRLDQGRYRIRAAVPIAVHGSRERGGERRPAGVLVFQSVNEGRPLVRQ
jgi:hypothetical protein